MSTEKSSGLYAFLFRARVYDVVQVLLGGRKSRKYLVRHHLMVKEGDRVLDIGCGTGNMYDLLDKKIQYVGFDLNEEYIRVAKERFNPEAGYDCRFFCDDVYRTEFLEEASFDWIIAAGMLHHLDDDGVEKLVNLASRALKPGGKFVTLDGVYTDDQSRLAKWILARDRGEYIRTVDGYRDLIKKHLSGPIRTTVEEGLFTMPYTGVIFEAEKQ